MRITRTICASMCSCLLAAMLITVLAGCFGGGVTPPPPAMYTVSGWVTDAFGQGIDGVNMTITGSSTGTATTGADGHWNKTGLTGTVTITPSKPGFVFEPESRTVSAAANDISFVAIDEAATYSVSGLVLDDKGSPLKDATIAFNRGFQAVKTGSDGTWEKAALHGTVLVTASKPGWHFSPMGYQISDSSDSVDFTGHRIAGQLLVPSQYSTIQAAIDAAADGDTIIVSPGTYTENVNFKGKSIVVQSVDPADPATRAATIIDGGKRGPGVRFSNGEPFEAVLQGFTIRNGSGTEIGGETFGGGIFITDGSSPTIMNNTITQNAAGLGSGVCVLEFDLGPAQQNVFSKSVPRQYRTLEGSSVRIFPRSRLESLGRGGSDPSDLDLRSRVAVGQDDVSAPMIVGNTITGNQASYYGGGLAVINSAAMISSNEIDDNQSDYGAGIFCGGALAEIEANTLRDNHGSIGVAVCAMESVLSLEGNDISGNVVTHVSTQGSIADMSDSLASLAMNTISSNRFPGESVYTATVWFRDDSNDGWIPFVELLDNDIVDNEMPGVLARSVDLVLDGNQVSHNERFGVEVDIRHCEIVNNLVEHNSGIGLLLLTSSVDDLIVEPISGNVVTNNTGYGIYVDVPVPVTLEGNTVAGNEDTGMVVKVKGGAATIRENLIEGNSGFDAGGIDLWAPAIVEDNTIACNSSKISGGAVCANAGGVTLRRNYFAFNSAHHGGAVSINGLNNVIEDNTFHANTADSDGGAISQAGSYAAITGNLFDNNAAQRGAGIYVSIPIKLESNTFVSNAVSECGAAMYIAQNGRLLDMDGVELALPDTLNTYGGNSPDNLAFEMYRFSGSVKDSGGNPLSGVEVELQEVRFGGLRYELTTDDGGVFALTESQIVYGRVIVTPSAPGYVFTPESIGVSAPYETPEFIGSGLSTGEWCKADGQTTPANEGTRESNGAVFRR